MCVCVCVGGGGGGGGGGRRNFYFSSILGVLVPDQSNKWLDSSFSSHILAFSIFSIEKWNEMLCLLINA